MAWDGLGLMPELIKSIDELDWNLPTDIQDEAIPLILGGGDVMAAAETGSGKTAAFSLPLIQLVHEYLRSVNESKANTEKMDISSSSEINIRINRDDTDPLISIDDSGLNCTNPTNKNWAGGRANYGVLKGKAYYEAAITKEGLGRFGWSTIAANHELGKDGRGFGFGGTGMKSFNGNFEAYGEKFGVGDIVGCYLDRNTSEVSYSINGKHCGKAFDIPQSIKASDILFPAFASKGGNFKFNFGDEPFKYNPNFDFKGISSMSTDEISGGSQKSINFGKKFPLGLILEPSRDLAEQVARDIEIFSKYVNSPEINVQLLVGGDNNKAQKKSLSGGVDIIVGTLGCIMGLFDSKTLDMTQVRFFILDEADKLAEKDNISSVLKLYNAIPIQGVGDKRLQVCFFSATLHSPEITELASKICYNPTWVDLKGVESVPDTVHHVIYRIDISRDTALLNTGRTKAITDGIHTNDSKDEQSVKSQLLKEIKLQVLLGVIDKFKMSQCIIFCRTNVDCDNLETFLCSHGGGSKFKGKSESGKENEYSCCVLAGMRDQNQRRVNLEAFKDGNVRFLICTDVAARGIDIKNLPYVINMTLPDQSENYIHRIGRVGRAECMGLAISIVASDDVKEQVWFHKCNNRGKGCINRKTADKGGCTIWQDEGELLQAVEKRLHNKIPSLSPSYELPPELAELGIEYGEKAGPSKDSNIYHVDELRPAVAELYDLEILSQNNFNTLKLNFGML